MAVARSQYLIEIELVDGQVQAKGQLWETRVVLEWKDEGTVELLGLSL